MHTNRVQHLEHSVLLAGIQSVDDDSHTRLVLSEAVDGLCHFGHELNFMLQNLYEGKKSEFPFWIFARITFPEFKVHGFLFYSFSPYLHKSFTLEFVQVVGGAVQPFPLRVEDGVGHLPPGPAVEQQGQAHHTGHGYQHRVHRQVLGVHLENNKRLHCLV